MDSASSIESGDISKTTGNLAVPPGIVSPVSQVKHETEKQGTEPNRVVSPRAGNILSRSLSIEESNKRKNEKPQSPKRRL